jgi:hypothetical protein
MAVSGAGGHGVHAGLLVQRLPKPGELGNHLMLCSESCSFYLFLSLLPVVFLYPKVGCLRKLRSQKHILMCFWHLVTFGFLKIQLEKVMKR